MHALSEDVDEDGDGEHGAAAAKHPERDSDRQPKRDRDENHRRVYWTLAAIGLAGSIVQPCLDQVPTPPSAT